MDYSKLRSKLLRVSIILSECESDMKDNYHRNRLLELIKQVNMLNTQIEGYVKQEILQYFKTGKCEDGNKTS